MKLMVQRLKRVRIARVLAAVLALPFKAKDAILLLVFMGYAGAVYAQSAPGQLTQVVTGICRLTRFVSETVIFAVLGLAIAGYGIAFAMNSMRDGAMEGGLRIAFGGGIAISAIAIVTFMFNQNAC